MSREGVSGHQALSSSSLGAKGLLCPQWISRGRGAARLRPVPATPRTGWGGEEHGTRSLPEPVKEPRFSSSHGALGLPSLPPWIQTRTDVQSAEGVLLGVASFW